MPFPCTKIEAWTSRGAAAQNSSNTALDLAFDLAFRGSHPLGERGRSILRTSLEDHWLSE